MTTEITGYPEWELWHSQKNMKAINLDYDCISMVNSPVFFPAPKYGAIKDEPSQNNLDADNSPKKKPKKTKM